MKEVIETDAHDALLVLYRQSWRGSLQIGCGQHRGILAPQPRIGGIGGKATKGNSGNIGASSVRERQQGAHGEKKGKGERHGGDERQQRGLTCDHRGDAEGQVKHTHHNKLPRELIPGNQDGTRHAEDSVNWNCHS